MRTAWMRLLGLFRRERSGRDLDEEIRVHLAMQEEEFRRAGMDAAAARLAALRQFGGVARTAEAYREQGGVPWLESAARDVRYALRRLRRSPGFTAAAVLSLALGIGANTAIFSLFHALMLRLLPVARPQELVSFIRIGGWGNAEISSYPLYLSLRQQTDVFRDVAARSIPQKVRFQGARGDRIELASREFVSGNYFRLLGVAPALGRLFTDDDNRVAQGHPVAVLSYDFWRNRFGGDPGMIGRTLVAGDQTLTVVGVAAPGFHGIEVERRTQFWEPAVMAMPAAQLNNPGMHWVCPIARLAPGVSRHRAQAAADAIMQQYLSAHYGTYPNAAFRRKAMEQRLEVRGAGTGVSLLRDEFGRPLGVLMAAVGLVLLVACTNLANLLLARGAARRKEIALRYSLGATRGRLVRQGLVESLLLAAAGCVAGAIFAFWGEGYILRFIPGESSDPFSTALDTTVLAFTVGVALFSAILFGLAPALRSTAIDPAAGLQWRGAQAAGAPPGLRRALVVAQVAFSAVLVVLAGLFGHSLAQLRAVDPGFRSRNVIAFQMDFPPAWTAAPRRAARDRFLAGAEALPGVLSVSYGFPGPFQGGSADYTIRVPGSERTAREPASVEIQYAGPRHFETIGSVPLFGRDFDRKDTAESRKVAIVNESFARVFFPGGSNPLGRAVSFDDSRDGGAPTYIVGVVRDMTHYGLRQGVRPTIYVPWAQKESGWPPTLLVRAQTSPAAIIAALRGEARKLGPDIALTEPRTIRQQIDDSIFQDRLLAMLSGFFGALALGLAAIGLYGVVAYATARRSAELGIRIALGARRATVLWMVLRDALALVVLGLGLGLPAALLAARAVGSVLFEVKPADPATFALTACVLASIALTAAFLPARRAASLQPVNVLRHE